MKHFFTALLLFAASFTSGQIVNIPDTIFKQVLLNYSPEIDINLNGEIEVTEALAVTELIVNPGSAYLQIYDITGIQAFSNLQVLNCSRTFITNLDVSNMVNLKSVHTSYSDLYSVNVSGCYNLEELFLDRGDLHNLNLGNISKLRTLNCANSTLLNLDLTACDSLSYLYLNGTSIQNLNVSNLVLLQNISGFTTIGHLNARGCTGLINIGSALPTTGIHWGLDVTNCINLQTVSFDYSSIQIFDFSTCVNLREFTMLSPLFASPYLNIKNGSFATINLGPGYNINVCADDFEISAIIPMLSNYSGTVNINSFCSFTPGGNYNTIKGNVRLDLNNNGCTSSEPGIGFVPIRITDVNGNNIYKYSASTGNFAHYAYADTLTLAPYFAYPYFSISPAGASVSFDTANSLIDSADFCVIPNGIHNDLEITFLPVSPARPGFDIVYQLIYKNRGSQTLSGNAQISFDNSKMNFVFASENVSAQIAGQLTWDYSNLQPFGYKSVYVTFNLLPAPVNNINDTLTYLAVVNPIAADETPFDNIFILPQRIRGSLDPNDKQCLEGSNISITEIDKFLHYIIRFQNLGTDTAFNIVVTDTLSAKLDWESFEFISSSHTCDVQQRNGKMEFFFQNINLPHSAINEPASHGFVAFKIKPKSTVVIGDSLNNRAAIYFDFNLPVITNTATTIVSPVGPVPVRLEYFFALEKGMANLLRWKATCSEGLSSFNIERSADGIYFVKIGNLTATHTRCQLPFDFIDEHPLTGKNYYRLKITDPDGLSYYSKVVVVGYDKAGFEIIAVTHNPQGITAYFNSEKQEFIDLKVIGTDGKTIFADSKTFPTGSSQLKIPLKNIAAGVYTLVAYTDKSEIISRRFIR